jgi:hypothetical protein
MTSLFRRVCLCTCGLAMLASGATSYGVTVSLRAVKKNNVEIAPTNMISAEPGDEIVADIFWSGWGSVRPGEDPQLRTFQAGIDGFGSYINDNGVMLLPKGWDTPPLRPCITNLDCDTSDPCAPSCSAGNANSCVRTCINDFGCSSNCPDFPVCSPLGAYCVGVNHVPNNYNYICTPVTNTCTGNPLPRPDYCHAGFATLVDLRRVSVNFEYGSATFSGEGPTDSGQSCYGGTLTLVVQPDACGTLEVDFLRDESSTYVLDEFFNTFTVDTTQPLVINTSIECPSVVPKIKSTLPENCDVDHRYPHSPTATLPAFWFNPDFEFTINFDGLPGDNGGMFQVGDFAVSQTGAGGSPPSILPETFSQNGTSVTFSLNRPAVATRWTCVRYVPCEGTDNECMACWARFPADVNGDRIVNSTDLTALIGIVQDGTPADEVDCDMDRSGSCVAPDIIGWIDLFNGAGEFIAWGAQPMQVTCPSQ